MTLASTITSLSSLAPLAPTRAFAPGSAAARETPARGTDGKARRNTRGIAANEPSTFAPTASAAISSAAMAESVETPDAELVARTQAGESAAFDGLVRKYSPRLYGLVYHMTSNHEDTNDLLQDIFAKAYRSVRGFRGRSSFYTWLHTIAVNMTINFLKKRGRRHLVSLDDENSHVENDKEFVEMTSGTNPVREADLAELQQRLNGALQKLSEDHRMAVTLFDIQGLPHKEISQILGVSEGTVRSRLFYAHRQLQNYLEEFRQR